MIKVFFVIGFGAEESDFHSAKIEPFKTENKYSCCREELQKKNADTVTAIIVTKLPGSALFIQLCCTGCGARHRWD